MYGGTTDVKDSPAASLYAQFYPPLLFLLHFTRLYCTILHHTALFQKSKGAQTFGFREYQQLGNVRGRCSCESHCEDFHFCQTPSYCTILHHTALPKPLWRSAVWCSMVQDGAVKCRKWQLKSQPMIMIDCLHCVYAVVLQVAVSGLTQCRLWSQQ